MAFAAERGGGERTKAAWVEWAVYGVAALLAAAALYRARRFHEDDAYITMRYVERWVAGKGLTWTDGERVEGYSDPLWLLQLAALRRVGLALPVASRILGVGYFAALFAVFRRARALPASVFVLATLPGLSVWAMGGLETVSFAFWVVLGAWQTERVVREGGGREAALAGAALGAAALTRPEGVGVGLVALAWLASARRWSGFWTLAMCLAAPVLTWEAFRIAYYGDVLANSARAKLGDYPLGRSLACGLEYLAASRSTWAYAVAAALVILVVSRRSEALWMLGLGLPVLAALVVGGGDHMIGARLFVPVVALVVFAAGLAASRALAPRTRRAAAVLLVMAAALQAPLALAEDREPDRAAVLGGVVGRFLEHNLPAGSLVAISVAGSTAFEAPSLRFVDTLGLNDEHIARREVQVDVTRWQVMAAHRRGDGPYVLSRSPDVVVLGGAAGYLGFDDRQWFLTDYELLRLPEFRMDYRAYGLPISEAAQYGYPGLTLLAYLRKGSAAAQALAREGSRVHSPWDVPRARWTHPAASYGVTFEDH